MDVRIKRIYDSRSDADGMRILIDRLWPRGLKKEDAGIDLWLKEIAPSDDLRRWFHHEAGKWAEFRERYEKELRENEAAVKTLEDRIGRATATLLYGAKDTEHNQAIVLRDFLMKRRH
ncbi:DUF488 domain-containing protein [Pseudaminobacter sp. NGMCC 1.201702]|uniref:DUF488 domain-containing protein n=1 Tax=Pseudaminobacter sp. NGMCC 1.201702 TaxID=3391825 RepID=UPI0039EF1E4E